MMQWEDHALKESHKKSVAQDEDACGTEEVLSHSTEPINRIINGTPTHVSIDADPDCTCQDEFDVEETPGLSINIEKDIKNSNLGCANHMTKSMLCLNEESQDEVKCRLRPRVL